MGCCGEEKRVHSSNVNGRWVPPNLDNPYGPTKNRQCTDVFFLMFFTVFCIFLIIVLGVAGYRGDPLRLLYGYDNYGNVCSKKNTKIADAAQSGQDMTKKEYLITKLDGSSLKFECASQCPEDYQEVGYRRCYKQNSGVTAFKDVGRISQGFFQQLGSDITLCAKEIAILCCIALGLACFLVLVLRFCAAIVIWAILILVGIATIALTAFLWYSWHQVKKKARELPEDHPEKRDKQEAEKCWLVAAIISTIFMVIFLLIIFFMRKRIKLVAELFKEAGKAIGSMPLLLFQPLLTFTVLALVCCGMIVGYFYVHTSGNPKVDEKGYVTFPLNTFFQVFRWYQLFGFFWLVQFIFSCQDMVIAGAVATWFFTRDKSRLQSPILVSIGNLLRYHLGSVAFGSFIIAIIRIIRFIMKQVEKQLKNHSAASCMLKCCQCCLTCFENFLLHLNKNAYVEIAISGYSFCTAAKSAFRLITSNALRIVAINSIGDFVLFVGKVGITVAVAFIGIEIIKGKEGLTYDWTPIVIVCVFAFLISHAFLDVYEMTIDTLFVCFCKDCEENDGVLKPYFMSRGLMGFVENSRKVLNIMDEGRKRGG